MLVRIVQIHAFQADKVLHRLNAVVYNAHVEYVVPVLVKKVLELVWLQFFNYSYRLLLILLVHQLECQLQILVKELIIGQPTLMVDAPHGNAAVQLVEVHRVLGVPYQTVGMFHIRSY